MRYEWTGTGSLALSGRVVGAGGTDEERVFTSDECPSAEKFVARGQARRLDPIVPPVKTVSPKVDPKPAPKPAPEPEPMPDLKVDVGIMEATLGAGVDGNFGTEDDTLVIKPKPKPEPKPIGPVPVAKPKPKPEPEPKKSGLLKSIKSKVSKKSKKKVSKKGGKK